MRRVIEYLSLIGFVAAAFVLSLLPGGVWAGLLTANLRMGIETPWSVPVALAVLWLAWRWAGGRWPWPRSEVQRAYRRANPMSLRATAWALLANGFSLVALIGVWIVLRHLVKTPGNPTPDFSAYPLPITCLIIACAAVVGAVSEEVGLRGYLQGRLERIAPWPAAVVLMALVAAPGHALTQGFAWPTLLFYVLADATYGLTAYLTDSILPGVVAHAAGLALFFAFIWPHDQARQLVSLDHAGLGFWGLVAQTAIFTVLAAWAFVRLAGAHPRGTVCVSLRAA